MTIDTTNLNNKLVSLRVPETEDDFEALCKLGQSFISECFKDANLQHYFHDTEQLADFANISTFIMVLYEKNYAGFVELTPTNGRVKITKIYVSPSYRRRGIARMLISFSLRAIYRK